MLNNGVLAEDAVTEDFTKSCIEECTLGADEDGEVFYAHPITLLLSASAE